MHHVVQRFGFRITRGWATFLLAVGALVGTAFWIGPFRPLPAELKLVALGGDGQFRSVIGIPRTWADTAPPQPDVPSRFPMLFAVYNEGARPAEPRRLAISLPARFRLSDSKGQALPGSTTIGNPLIRYTFDVRPGSIQPGNVPRLFSRVDTLWLEPVVPSYYCSVLSDSVPEFVPAPPFDPKSLATVRMFYTFETRENDRQSGLLTVQLDPQLLDRPVAPTPPIYPTTMHDPEAVKPALGELRRVGDRTSYCGDPGSPIELYDVLWETPEGGRFFVLYHGGAPRKYLYDLNRDSIIELEIWDPDSDGLFEASRPARMVIPEFLMPVLPPEVAVDSMRLDSTGAPVPRVEYPPALFHDTDAGPFRFWRIQPRSDTTAAADSTARRDTTAAPAPVRPETARTGVTVPIEYPPAVFRDTDAGIFRYWRAQQRARGVEVEAEEPPPVRRRPTGPRILGTPVPRPDSIRIDSIRRANLRRDTMTADTIILPR